MFFNYASINVSSMHSQTCSEKVFRLPLCRVDSEKGCFILLRAYKSGLAFRYIIFDSKEAVKIEKWPI